MVEIKIPFRIGTQQEEINMYYFSGQKKIYDEGLIDILPCYKISVVLTDGVEARLLSGSSWVLEAGNVSIFNPYEAHFGRFLRSGHFEYVEFLIPQNVFDNETDLSRLLLFIKEGEELHYFLERREQVRVLEIINNAVEKCISDDDLKSLKLSAYFVELIDFLQSIPKNRLTREPLRVVPQKIRQAMEYISQNFVHIKDINEIAAFVGISSRYLTRSFRKYMGTTPYEYLLTTKLHNAESILNSGGTVTEACYDSGFTDYSHFIQIFKKYYGVTPNRFKKL